jgi:hypothetical protein
VSSHPPVDVVVIGAGQAGLSTAWALQRQGLEPETGFVVLDGERRPGGAWQHRWPSLTVGTTHRVHDLPGLPFFPGDGEQRAVDVVPDYFVEYERRFALPVHRPVRVRAVHRTDDGGASAVQLLGEISWVTSTTWVTRRPPVWRDGPFDERRSSRGSPACTGESHPPGPHWFRERSGSVQGFPRCARGGSADSLGP